MELNVIYIHLGEELSFGKVFAFSSATVASAATSTEKKENRSYSIKERSRLAALKHWYIPAQL